MGEPRSPEALAALVADGRSPDWDEALRGASSDEERRLIGHLRLVEGVARVLGHHEPEAPSMASQADVQSWGHLSLREKLGQGGFGAVYRAWDARLEREVALKLLERSDAPSEAAASVVIEEGRLLAKLRHPNVVNVHGAEIHDGRVGIWMELIRGRSLEQILCDHGALGAREASLIGVDVCRALAAVHGAGVIHRDVKAANVMREEGGRVLLMDFGAGVTARLGAEPPQRVSGTPMYMAPELFAGASADERSDIYSVGVLLYRLVTQAYPVEARTWNELREKHARKEAKLLRDRRSDLPEAFVGVVERATAHRPEDRFATAGQMEQALSHAFGNPGAALPHTGAAGKSRTRQTLFWGIAGALALTAFAITQFRGEPQKPLTPSSPPSEDASGTTAVPSPPTSESAHRPGASYTVEATLYRVAGGPSRRERLDPGARLSLGDELTLEFRASEPLHVYVVNEDEAGHAYALFPLPALDRKNPLPADSTLVLPGTRGGKPLSWGVDSPGGREHLMILASPSRLVEFEAEMNALARPGELAVSLPGDATSYLRGLGALKESRPAAGESAGRLFDMAERLASRPEVVRGVWLRQIELENPRE